MSRSPSFPLAIRGRGPRWLAPLLVGLGLLGLAGCGRGPDLRDPEALRAVIAEVTDVPLVDAVAFRKGRSEWIVGAMFGGETRETIRAVSVMRVVRGEVSFLWEDTLRMPANQLARLEIGDENGDGEPELLWLDLWVAPPRGSIQLHVLDIATLRHFYAGAHMSMRDGELRSYAWWLPDRANLPAEMAHLGPLALRVLEAVPNLTLLYRSSDVPEGVMPNADAGLNEQPRSYDPAPEDLCDYVYSARSRLQQFYPYFDVCDVGEILTLFDIATGRIAAFADDMERFPDRNWNRAELVTVAYYMAGRLATVSSYLEDIYENLPPGQQQRFEEHALRPVKRAEVILNDALRRLGRVADGQDWRDQLEGEKEGCASAQGWTPLWCDLAKREFHWY